MSSAPPQSSCIYQQAHHHNNNSIPSSSALLRLYGCVTAVSLELCEPMAFHNRAAFTATTKLTTVTGSTEEGGMDAMFRLSDASVYHLLQRLPCYEHRVSSLREVGLRLDPSFVHLGDFTSMPLGSFAEISVSIPAAAASNSSSLPTSSQQQQQHVMVLCVHDIHIPSSSHLESTAASSAERIASLVGWVPSKFQFLVDRWCPHVAGHRSAKELLMLVALALRLDITTTTTTSNDQERSSAPLRVLLRGPKGCGKTLLLAAFENLHDSLHTLVIGTTSSTAGRTAAKQNSVAPGGSRRGSGGGGGGGLSATKSPIDPDVLLPHIAPLPSAGSSAQCQYYGNSYSSSVVVALHCGQLLSSSVVLVDDWNNVSSASSCGPAGSMPRAIIDVLLDDTWALPMAPSSAARFQSSASGGGGNCLAVERIAGLQRGRFVMRFVIATDTADAKKPLSATASQDMYAKFHFIVALDVVSMEADASVVASQAIREASQMSRQRLASVSSSSALGVGRSQSQLLSQSMLSCNGRRSCSTNNNISSRSFGEDDGGFSSSISAFFNDDVLSSEKHLTRCETMDGGNMPLPREQTARQPSQCQPTPISTADILDEVAREFSRGDAPAIHQQRRHEEEGFLHAWVMYLLTTSGDQHPTQQQQWLIPFLGSNSSIIASSSSSFSHLPPLCELLDGVIRDDVPGFADAIVRLGVARHALDPDLPLVPDCMIDVLRVVASSTTSSATSSLQSHGNRASDDSAVAAAAQRKRLRCINGGDDGNHLTGGGNKKKLVGKKQIARRFHAALHQSSQSGTFENGEVPVGVCRVLFDKAVAAISGGVVAPGGGSGVMFEEIVRSLSYDGMLLKGKNGALKPL
ncbi:Hypothetical protein, putative [Bodo saltans]|uniref:Uncharacterized protein n=1 Tax=Bodo saltans TaxID=75058 RepID=A0A0S4IMG1_BODSA|nr:Hypothetical protein, putative [Bodo saltans]|eukprot:CUF44999.1 Hypothetical protein, putative [Bodo saltans]